MRLKRLICALAALCLIASAIPTTLGAALAAPRYYITVDLTNQIVTVYDNGNTTESGIVRRMICSSGRSGTPTPTGTYTLPNKAYSKDRAEWYYFPKYNCYAKWATRIVGGILFHSVLYTAAKQGPTKSSVNALGSKASHGCIRLRVDDARWIAQNCPAGTKCRIYNSGSTDNALRKRLLSRSFVRANETYDHFMGRESDGTLSRGDRGERVSQMQARLKALGFLNDTVDGIFGAKTEAAVKAFQAACDLKQTGAADLNLWARMFAVNAPTGTLVPLSSGATGPAVAALQKALIDLKLLEGEADGSYDDGTAEAVSRYQEGFGHTATGAADPALQDEMLERAESVKAEFGDDYVLVIATEAVMMARVKGKSAVRMRAKSSSKSKALMKLKRGTEVELLKQGKTWSRVRRGDKTGYVPNKYLEVFAGQRTHLAYAPGTEPTPSPTPEVFLPTPTPEVFIPTPTPDATPTPTPSATPTPTPTPSVTPSPTPEWIFFVEGAPELPEDGTTEPEAAPEESAAPEVDARLGDAQSARYAVIVREGAALYPRAEIDAACALAMPPVGTALTALGAGGGWVAVVYDGAAAYVPAEDVMLTDALPDGPVEALAPEVEPGAEPAPAPEAPSGDATGGLALEDGGEPVPEERFDVPLEAPAANDDTQ